jgi:predicted Rdx family selenoprotein
MHFSVLIVGDNYDEQLIPFDENLRTTFHDRTKELQEEYENGTFEVIQLAGGQRYEKFGADAEVFWKRKYEGGISNEDELVLPEGAKLTITPFNDFYKTFDEFSREYHGIEPDAGGRYGYWHNPLAKWDWYRLGGRWPDELPLKNGRKANEAIWRDVDAEKLNAQGAILLNGRWYDECDNEWKEWEKQFRQIIKSIEPNEPVVIIDCHI